MIFSQCEKNKLLWRYIMYCSQYLRFERNMFKNQRKCNKLKIQCFWRWIWNLFHERDRIFFIFSRVRSTSKIWKNPVIWVKKIPNLTNVRPLFTLSHRGSDNSRLLIVFKKALYELCSLLIVSWFRPIR